MVRRIKRSRSRLFAQALEEYVDRHSPDLVTEKMNEVCAEVGAGVDDFVSAVSRRILEKSEW